MFDETRAAFRDGDEAEAKAAFGRLRDELEAHFEKEDRLYYPAIRVLRPDRAEAVNRVGLAHEQFLRRFDLITLHIQAGKLDEAKRCFEEFAEAFIYHEIREEDLIRSLEKELAEMRPGAP
jgi:soluble cytochrome b562